MIGSCPSSQQTPTYRRREGKDGQSEAQAEHEATSYKCRYIPPVVDPGTSEGQTQRPGALWELGPMGKFHPPC